LAFAPVIAARVSPAAARSASAVPIAGHLLGEPRQAVTVGERDLEPLGVERLEHPDDARRHAVAVEAVVASGRLDPGGAADRAGRVQDEVGVRQVDGQHVRLRLQSREELDGGREPPTPRPEVRRPAPGRRPRRR